MALGSHSILGAVRPFLSIGTKTSFFPRDSKDESLFLSVGWAIPADLMKIKERIGPCYKKKSPVEGGKRRQAMRVVWGDRGMAGGLSREVLGAREVQQGQTPGSKRGLKRESQDCGPGTWEAAGFQPGFFRERVRRRAEQIHW